MDKMHCLYESQLHCITPAKLFAIYKFLIDIILHQIIYFVFKTSELRKKEKISIFNSAAVVMLDFSPRT